MAGRALRLSIRSSVRSTAPFWSILLLIVFYWFYVQRLSIKGVPVPHSHAQFLVFPFVVFTVAWVIRPLYKTPTFLLLGVIGCGLLFSGFSASFFNQQSKFVLFAPLKGDQLATKTRLLRAAYESVFGKNRTNNAKSVFDKIENHESALVALKSDPHALGIFWGDKKNLQVTLGEKATFMTPSRAEWMLELRQYKIITEIPKISAGLEPLDPTVKVIAAALVGTEIDMLQAGRLKVRWRSTVARSYLFFKLANKRLLEAVSGSQYQFAPLDCAIDSYKTSLKILRPAESPELHRAIMNNLSLALLLRGGAEQAKEDLRRSRQYILLATRAPKKKGLIVDSVDIARQNAKTVALFHKNGGFKRKQR